MDYLTCLRGHRKAVAEWKRSEIDPACFLCPVCSEVVDLEKPARRQSDRLVFDGRRAMPPGRCSAHVVSLIRKLEMWREHRQGSRLDCKDLTAAIKYLAEYRDVLAASDPTTPTGVDLDRLADPLPRELGETDEVFRRRVFSLAAERLVCHGS